MRISIFAIIMLCWSYVANASAKYNIDSLLTVLDKEVERSDEYVERHEQEITSLKNRLDNTRNDKDRYETSKLLFYSYQAFQNDSAMHYLGECRRYAQKMDRKDLEGEILSRWAFQYSTVGMYYEAREMLNLVDVSVLDAEGKAEFYNASMHLCHELAYYTNLPKLKEKLKSEGYSMIDSLTAVVGKHDALYYKWKGLWFFDHNNDMETLKLFTEWKDSARPGTRDYATAAYFMYLIHAKLGNLEEVKYWLIMSSLTDVRHAVMDQASLWALAEILANGDVGRAHNYISYSWGVAQRFRTKVRSGQISPILSTIDKALQDSTNKHNMHLRITVLVVSLLLLLLIILLVFSFRQHKKLGKSRDELHDANRRLQTANEQLMAVNDDLSLSNAMLNESNRVKEEYIGRFLNLCSLYIEKIEEQRKQVNKMVKARQYEELYYMTRSSDVKKKELEELYSNFDKAFMHLFPNFIDGFNELLRPEERITTENDSKLNTTLRIFALIRLGIDDSNKIAEFLNYSVHTIYNYRVRVRNAAICDRDEFERKVKTLGLSKTVKDSK